MAEVKYYFQIKSLEFQAFQMKSVLSISDFIMA